MHQRISMEGLGGVRYGGVKGAVLARLGAARWCGTNGASTNQHGGGVVARHVVGLGVAWLGGVSGEAREPMAHQRISMERLGRAGYASAWMRLARHAFPAASAPMVHQQISMEGEAMVRPGGVGLGAAGTVG